MSTLLTGKNHREGEALFYQVAAALAGAWRADDASKAVGEDCAGMIVCSKLLSRDINFYVAVKQPTNEERQRINS